MYKTQQTFQCNITIKQKFDGAKSAKRGVFCVAFHANATESFLRLHSHSPSSSQIRTPLKKSIFPHDGTNNYYI